MKYQIYLGRGFIFPVLFLLFSNLSAENPDSALKKIIERKSCFNSAAESFSIDIKTLMAVVFVERTLNFDWKDDALDIPLAYSGHNSSIGFCQIKMKTAYWIEVHLSDSTSEFYPGNFYHNMLPVSKSPNEIIEKLQRDSLNIHYAAGYIKIIQSFWKEAGFPIADRPGILGTLYSSGLFLPSGEIRIPNKNPKANLFGKKVKEVYKLFIDL